MDKYCIKAYAKINLGLDVLGRLDNGYHVVKMVMQTVNIYDELEFERIPEAQWKDSGSEQITLSTSAGDLPTDRNNLIVKAADLMIQKYGIRDGLKIYLQKNIPVAAGMAGGSSDAAATMKGINRIFDLGCTVQELMELGVKIGADVPYCIMGGTALAEGIGEILTPLEDAPECFLVIAKPDISVSTGHVYTELDSLPEYEHPDIDGIVSSINVGSLQGVLQRMGNVLELVTIKEYPVIREIKDRMRALGAVNCLMSGSGPTVFGIFTDEKATVNAVNVLKGEGLAKDVFRAEFL